jgi:thiamine biosynthesis lipoprotein
MQMDFGGMAKGYAAARIGEVLEHWQIRSALINLGGSSILTTGERDWLVGIADPSSPQHYAAIVVAKPGTAISCSGVYERSHIFDPRTGMPISGLRSAVAITKSAVLGEVLSKQLLLESGYPSGSHPYLRLYGSTEKPTALESNLGDIAIYART